MVVVRTLKRATLLVLIGVWTACNDRVTESPIGPAAPTAPDLRAAVVAQERHTDALLAIPGVVGTAVTGLPDGRAGMVLLLERPGIAGLPQALDGIPVTHRVTGRLLAFSDPTQRQRPAPAGFSVGHPAITAGTIGARVRDALGRVYVLSNNHVLANSNGATIGDPAYQPGPIDGGTAADQIATLADFQPITFTSTANNTMDAGIALSSVDMLDNATPPPSDDGYGMPNATIYGDANGDGVFDDRNALLGLTVQKYGRTTRLTHGQITGVNATVTVCYEVSGFECTKSARFVDQILIAPGPFSGGGDSGSLIVTDDGNLQPVALLFAGSGSITIANRIDLVLLRFGVAIDGFAPPPPGPLTDLAVTSMSGPSAVIQGSTAGVTVTVKNFGNQDVTSAFDVTLRDSTTQATVGAQNVPGLAAGASATLSFAWTPATNGDHLLVAKHSLTDDKATNDQRSVTIPVVPPVTDVAVTSISTPGTVIVGHTVNIGVTVANVGNQIVTGSFTVTLQDATGGVTIGTQTVSGGLTPGAGTTLGFSWNTTSAALGGHTLVASHDRTDDNAANNQLNSAVTIAPRPTDIGLVDITAPARVTQGEIAHVVVTVRNVGEVDVGASFTVVLTDGTAGGATIGTQTVAGLVAGATTTLDFPWNTAGADTVGHILFATQKLPDDNSTNDAIAIGIIVQPGSPPPAPSTDVAVTGVNAPSSVTQGTSATIGVTVQNVGGQSVNSSFAVTLTDQTAGVTLGTQTVAGLATGAVTTLSFSWNTTNAALGGHTLVASHNLADNNAANNQGSGVVTVAAQVTDLALSDIAAPSQVTQGDVAPVQVMVQNVGGQDVASFDVVLTDGSAGGAILGTQTIAGLARGASVTRTFAWNTTGAATGGHILIATQQLVDNDATNNARATGITVLAAPSADVAVTSLNAPSTVTQGSTVTIGVTVQNVGGLNVTSGFDVVLTDQTAGATLGTQTVTGLAAGAAATLAFDWSTTAAALGGHTLVATHTLTDANAANNQGSTTITLNAPAIDVAVTGVSAPASVTQGSSATIGVTVQNVGGQNVTSFNVVLTDQTAGVTLGTQPVSGLAAGAASSLSFSWTTTNAALGGHTLVATHDLTDDNAVNNQGSATVTVIPQPVDLALTDITAPAQVTVGDIVPVVVTVQNVGGQNVTTSFDVVLTDGSAGGVTIGTQTVAGLAMGAAATRTVNWNTAGASTGGHILIATQSLADNDASNNARAIGVTVNPPSVHVGNLGRTATNRGSTWRATVQITAHDHTHAVRSGATVRGSWNGSGSTVQCSTGSAGTCNVVLSSIPNSTTMVSFAVTSLTRSGYVYASSANHDPDGNSNGFSIIVTRP